MNLPNTPMHMQTKTYLIEQFMAQYAATSAMAANTRFEEHFSVAMNHLVYLLKVYALSNHFEQEVSIRFQAPATTWEHFKHEYIKKNRLGLSFELRSWFLRKFPIRYAIKKQVIHTRQINMCPHYAIPMEQLSTRSMHFAFLDRKQDTPSWRFTDDIPW